MLSLKNQLKGLIFKIAADERNLKKKLDFALKNRLLIILNFHKIAPPDQSSWKPFDPIIFREVMRYINKNFEVSTFSDLKDSKKDGIDRPRIIISFDDGYKDFIEYAMPILFELEVRVNQNVIPNCAIKGIPPLNVIAADWIGQAPLGLIQKLDIPNFNLAGIDKNRDTLGSLISQFLKFMPFADQKKYFNYLLPQFLEFDGFKWTKMMNLEEVKSISSIHEIGLHSMNHESMNQESDSYFQQDLLDCSKFADQELNISNPIYAFPNGAYRPSQLAILQSMHFSHILLVGDKVSSAKSVVHNRFNFHADSLDEARFKATGNLLSKRKSFSI